MLCWKVMYHHLYNNYFSRLQAIKPIVVQQLEVRFFHHLRWLSQRGIVKTTHQLSSKGYYDYSEGRRRRGSFFGTICRWGTVIQKLPCKNNLMFVIRNCECLEISVWLIWFNTAFEGNNMIYYLAMLRTKLWCLVLLNQTETPCYWLILTGVGMKSWKFRSCTVCGSETVCWRIRILNYYLILVQLWAWWDAIL